MGAEENLLTDRFHLNMGRIGGLIGLLYPKTGSLTPADATIQRSAIHGDLSRAIVVFLHATMEDSIRTMARERLSAAKSDALNNIPLVGKRDTKFDLRALSEHSGKTVDEVICESVEDYLSEVSFDSCAKIDAALSRMELDTRPFKPLYHHLDLMMKRRHRIVHEADFPSPSDNTTPGWTLGDDFQLCLWFLVIMAFHAQLRVSVDPADELYRWYFARNVEAIGIAVQRRNELALVPNESVSVLLAGVEKFCEGLLQVKAALRPPSEQEILGLLKK
jgi:hypothetical protein